MDTNKSDKENERGVCTGNCDIGGLEIAQCATCGWLEDWVPLSDPYSSRIQ
jgi:hypothetical protein